MVINLTEKATRAHTKEHNRRLVLKTIYDNKVISRAQVSRITRLTRTTVSVVVADLLEEELVEELGQGERAIGKPPTMLQINPNGRHMLSLDLSSDGFRGCVLNLRGEILHEIRYTLDGRRGMRAVELARSMAAILVEAASRPVLGMGVGAPGVVDSAAGLVRDAVNLEWVDLPLANILAEVLGDIPIHLANDSDLAGLAQYRFGDQDNGPDSLVLIKAGKGISAGIVLEGKLLRGDGFGAGEIGHVVVDPNGSFCTCGHQGCLEAQAGSENLVREVSAHAVDNSDSLLHEDAVLGRGLTVDALVQAIKNGDTTPLESVERAGKNLGIAVANLMGVLHIRHIFIAGSLAGFGDTLIKPLREEVARRTLPALSAHTVIEVSGLGDNVVTLGAAALVLSHALGIA